ncbi:MAG TPA: hypothetical protein VG965_01560 [Patescibacteria group bacterium]|nr:hypothetical protein [Patescibacteria group bacterium]
MSNIEDKHLEHLAKIQAMSNNEWYSWNSPIGISIFFISIAIIGYIVRLTLLLK